MYISLESSQLCNCRPDILNITEQLRFLLQNCRCPSLASVSLFTISNRPNINQPIRCRYDANATNTKKKNWIWILLSTNSILNVYIGFVFCVWKQQNRQLHTNFMNAIITWIYKILLFLLLLLFSLLLFSESNRPVPKIAHFLCFNCIYSYSA